MRDIWSRSIIYWLRCIRHAWVSLSFLINKSNWFNNQKTLWWTSIWSIHLNVNLVNLLSSHYSDKFFFLNICSWHDFASPKTLTHVVKRGSNMRCTLFPLSMVLSHWVFLARFLMRQLWKILCTLFPSLGFLSHWVFPGKVLMRHNICL